MMKTMTLALACVIAVPAAAQTGTSTPPASQTAKPNPLDKIVCRTEEALGSRLNTKRVCQTVREWRQDAEASREATERMQQGQGTVPST